MSLIQRIAAHPFFRILTFALKRALIIGVTIFIGIFLTVLIANQNNQIENSLERQIASMAFRRQGELVETLGRFVDRDEVVAILREETGLNKPYLERQFQYALNSLTFEWGDVLLRDLFFSRQLSSQNASSPRNIVLNALPNTLLLVVTANLVVFFFGLPLALHLSRKPGGWLDRFFAALAPLSSFPSWVIGLIFLIIFSFTLRWLPPSGMRGYLVDPSFVELVLAVGKHMILPVSAIIVSLLFQFIFTWRSYFLVYSQEDYVEHGRAQGLPSRVLERRYILRPTLPFIITSFALSLVGFWQATIALEVVFGWPGLGSVYVSSLPNFWGLSMFPGEMIITVAMVTTFAYILGATVLLLEIFYALVDPRIRVDTGSSARIGRILRRRPAADAVGRAQLAPLPRPPRPSLVEELRQSLAALPQQLRTGRAELVRIVRQFRNYPAAIAGLVVILFLVIGSVYALIALPYEQIGEEWSTDMPAVTGLLYLPKSSMPEWTNIFRSRPLLSVLTLNSAQPADDIVRSEVVAESGTRRVLLTFPFDYEYGQPPDQAMVYFTTRYQSKRPFVSWSWITPDGRQIELEPVTEFGISRVDLAPNVFSGNRALRLALDENPALASLAQVDEERMPLHYLFTQPGDQSLTLLPGRYELQIEAVLFEPEAQIEAELVMLGQVYGPAGTDSFGRELVVPLLWGMPFVLTFGLLAAFGSVFVALMLGAAAAWYGGAVDWLVQRLTDLNMVLPILAISAVLYSYYTMSIWTVLVIITVFSAFGSPVKTFRSAFLQVRQEPYIEGASAYGASNIRIIFKYMIPKIVPVLIPQLIYLVPSFVFLEATLGMLNIRSIYPTWGRVIYSALNYGLSSWGSRLWVLQPLTLVFLTGLAFAVVGFALDKILNPKISYDT